jgi:hypothetical protein
MNGKQKEKEGLEEEVVKLKQVRFSIHLIIIKLLI